MQQQQRGNGRGQQGPGARQQLTQVQQRQMQQQMQRRVRIPKLRFHVLQEMHGSYLTLRIFNYLDDRSRYSIFAAMGWPADNYNARKAQLARQIENRRRIKAGLPPLECTNPNCNNARCPAKLKKAEEEARANGLLHTHQDEIVGLGTVEEEGEDSKGEAEGKKPCSEARPVEVEGEGGEESPPTDDMAKLEVDGTSDDGKDSYETNDGEDEKQESSNAETKVEADASESKEEPAQEVRGTPEENCASAPASDEGKVQDEEPHLEDSAETEASESEDEEEEPAQVQNVRETPEGCDETSDPDSDEETGQDEKKPEDDKPLTPEEEALKKYRDEQELLPLLSSRVDPDTLLNRLNTRRLYKRINYYKRETRRKILLMAEAALKDAERGADLSDEDKIYTAIQQVMGAKSEGISDMYDYDVKEKNTINVVWKKNMTVVEMASQEWMDLLELARCRCV